MDALYGDNYEQQEDDGYGQAEERDEEAQQRTDYASDERKEESRDTVSRLLASPSKSRSHSFAAAKSRAGSLIAESPLAAATAASSPSTTTEAAVVPSPTGPPGPPTGPPSAAAAAPVLVLPPPSGPFSYFQIMQVFVCLMGFITSINTARRAQILVGGLNRINPGDQCLDERGPDGGLSPYCAKLYTHVDFVDFTFALCGAGYALIALPAVGRWSDRQGRKRWLMMAPLALLLPALNLLAITAPKEIIPLEYKHYFVSVSLSHTRMHKGKSERESSSECL